VICTTKQTETNMRWVHLTRERALERWCNGEAITLVPCKCHPTSPMGVACTIYPSLYRGPGRQARSGTF